MDLMMLEQHQYVVGSFLFHFLHPLDALNLGVLQNLGAQNLDVLQPFRDVAHLVHLVVAAVDVELHYLLRMDYYQDVADLDEVDVELHYLLRMDYYQDVVPEELLVLEQMVQLILLLHSLLLLVQPSQPRVMPSVLQDRHQARQRVRLRVLDLLLQFSWRQQSSLQLLF
jgi:hypothetical protein